MRADVAGGPAVVGRAGIGEQVDEGARVLVYLADGLRPASRIIRQPLGGVVLYKGSYIVRRPPFSRPRGLRDLADGEQRGEAGRARVLQDLGGRHGSGAQRVQGRLPYSLQSVGDRILTAVDDLAVHIDGHRLRAAVRRGVERLAQRVSERQSVEAPEPQKGEVATPAGPQRAMLLRLLLQAVVRQGRDDARRLSRVELIGVRHQGQDQVRVIGSRQQVKQILVEPPAGAGRHGIQQHPLDPPRDDGATVGPLAFP
ncbi:hypothetical protein [Catenulispora sp. GP43]|uniref:hypothetical protein n=1 Tax=Catenulispora sp. GP43 TaxID=3156263 RepID=UPI0035159418